VPNYYSIKFGVGTADADEGRTTSAPTGAYTAANSYPSVYDLFNTVSGHTAPVPGDILVMPNGTTETWAGNKVLGITDGITLVSTKAALREDSEAGAIIQTTAGGDLGIFANVDGVEIIITGVSFISNDKLNITSNNNNRITIQGGTIEFTTASTNDYISMPSKGSLQNYNNVDFKHLVTSSGGVFLPTTAATININGGSLDDSRLIYSTNVTGNGGFEMNINNFDMSLHDTTLPMFNFFYSSTQKALVNISRSKIPASSFEFVDNSNTLANYKVDVWSCDNGSGYHYFEYNRPEGRVKESETVYRTAGDLYDKDISTTHFSAEYQPNSNVVLFSNPLSPRPIKTLKLDLSSAVTLRFFILQQDASATPDKLTHGNVQLRAVHPDTTDTALGVTVNTGEEEATPITVLNAGAADNLDDSTEAWTGSSGNVVKQQIEITIPQNAQTGMDKAVVEFWLDVSIDLDTPSTELFIDTLPDDIS